MKKKSRTTKQSAKQWVTEYIKNEVESGTDKKHAVLWAKEIIRTVKDVEKR